MVRTVKHPELGEITIIAAPFHFSETPCDYKYHAPKHGEHTKEVLEGLGYSQEEQEDLRKKKII